MVRRTGWILLGVMVGLVVGGIATGLVDPLPSLQAQTTSPLTIQPETGRVGVGTTSPSAKLDVAGNVKAQGGVAPNYDSGWVAVSANTHKEVTLAHGLASVPSNLMLLQCGAVADGNCTTRTVMAGTRGYPYGSAVINPVTITADATRVYIGITVACVWGYWSPTSGLIWTGDADGHCTTGYYRVLAWK